MHAGEPSWLGDSRDFLDHVSIVIQGLGIVHAIRDIARIVGILVQLRFPHLREGRRIDGNVYTLALQRSEYLHVIRAI